MDFKDHFSGHAGLYAQARPHYPDALFEWIAQAAPASGCVWDAACGNGQASVALSRHFRKVIATDPSAQQIAQAHSNPSIEYRVEAAEHSSLADQSVDAVTVAQALHWFDLPRFIAEVRRVARPGALFAAWSYAGCSVTPEVDEVILRLYDGILGAYWPPERRLVDEGYASLSIPFAPVEAPAFEMRTEWNADQLLAYLRSWSAAQRYRKATGGDAVAGISEALRDAWGDAQGVRAVRWQLAVRAHRVG
ncbi:MAG TPA: class I SAM-dependent methyltransferase [Rhodanobacteraceae bacterium]|nr:class I SAM-dependent methyltransferase [Rhodanobacteraceae bacterium]